MEASNIDVALVAMPWPALSLPSIQIGTLHALLEAGGHGVRSHSLYVEFARHIAASGFGREDYDEVAHLRWAIGAGEWVFAVPPFREPSRAEDDAYDAWVLQQADGALLARLYGLRELVPAFLDRAADEVLSGQPRLVGFTTTFSQTVPSLALAALIKKRAPGVAIAFGGAGCFGDMGSALLDSFACIDLVVTGEAETVLSPAVAELLAGEAVQRRDGLLVRDELARPTAVMPASAPRMDELPVPRYDEYFARLESTGVEAMVGDRIKLTVETARGCWWGQKHHCTFCGLNGTSMAFRSKSPERALAELEHLARRHGRLDFEVVDNIMDLDYLTTVLPRIAESELDYDLFYETKANLSRAQLETMKRAGVRAIQPGIESLDTDILRRMRKGTTALQNVRLLKWCAELEIRVGWNILYGFGGEDPAAYDRMGVLAASLGHLQPPYLCQATAQRFSPMFDAPAELGIELTGPMAYYRHIFPQLSEQARERIAYFFDHRFVDGRDPKEYVHGISAAISRWNEHHRRSYRRLQVRDGGDYVRVEDRRSFPRGCEAAYVLEGPQAEAYRLAEAGATFTRIRRGLEDRFPGHLSAGELHGLLEELCEARLMAHLDGKYLALALRDRRTQPQVESSPPRRVSLPVLRAAVGGCR
jgi:ribosomal peptide maturation radical SAM protein 1